MSDEQSMKQCQEVLRKAGKAYPRTCQVCGLGPCRYTNRPPDQQAENVIMSPSTSWADVYRTQTAAIECLRAENERLKAALTDAIVEVESWGAYAPDYFQTKHNLAGTLDRLRAAMAQGK